MKKRVFLIVSADGDVKVHKRRPPKPCFDQIVVPLDIVWPEGWAVLAPAIEVRVPDPPVVTVP